VITRSSTALTHKAINTWLGPLRPVLDPAGTLDWPRLQALDTALDAALTGHPVGANLPAGAERSRRLQAIRRELADHGHMDTTGRPSLFGVCAQFVCGYRDIDLRDTTGRPA
jgi:hypothetical protein